MPNGGSDNCQNCRFYRDNRLKAAPRHDDGRAAPSNNFRAEQGYCELRGFYILSSLWTYCANYHTGVAVPDGPVFSAGLDDHVRLPWAGNEPPRFIEYGICGVCKEVFHRGIEIESGLDIPGQFCSDRHYWNWWKLENPDMETPWTYDFGEAGHGASVSIDYRIEQLHLNRIDLDGFKLFNIPIMHFAAAAGYADVIHLLVDKGANIEVRDDSGATPLHLAAEKGRIGTTKALIDLGADVSIKQNDGRTALHRAACFGHQFVVDVLLAAGAEVDPTAGLHHGNTPLFFAVDNNHLECAGALIDAGADMDRISDLGMNPLHIAVRRGNVTAVEFLVSAGADLNATGRYGTPMDIATAEGHDDIIQFMRKQVALKSV